MAACGLTEYVGQAREYGRCALTFRKDDAQVRLGLEDLDGLSWDAAVALHESGLGPEWRVSSGTLAGGAHVHWTHGPEHTMALVSGWSRPRRITWPASVCSEAGREQVAAAMARAPERPPARPRVSAAKPVARDGEAGASLLYAHVDRAPRPADAPRHLPQHAKALILDLLALAARDELTALPSLLAEAARWGLPDRRELDAHPVLGEDAGASFLAHFRAAAARFPGDAVLVCPLVPEEGRAQIEAGTAPMWCAYLSEDGLDVLSFRMRMHGGAARLEHVGMFAEPPGELRNTHPLPIPPMVPTPGLAPTR